MALQAMVKTTPVAIPESDFLYLMDDYKCIKEEMIPLNTYFCRRIHNGQSYLKIAYRLFFFVLLC